MKARLPDWARFLLPGERNRKRRIDRLKLALVFDVGSLAVVATLVRNSAGHWFRVGGLVLMNGLYTVGYVFSPIARPSERRHGHRLQAAQSEAPVDVQLPRHWRGWLRFPARGSEKAFDHKEDRIKLVALVTTLIFALNTVGYVATRDDGGRGWVGALPVLPVVPLVWLSFIRNERPVRLWRAIVGRVVGSILATAFVLLPWNS